MEFNQIAFKIPIDDLETFEIRSGKNVLVLREPVAADYLLAEGCGQPDKNIHERCFILAERLAVTWNGKPGVSAIEIGMINRSAYRELINLISGFFMDIMPSIGENIIKKYDIPQDDKKLVNSAK